MHYKLSVQAEQDIEDILVEGILLDTYLVIDRFPHRQKRGVALIHIIAPEFIPGVKWNKRAVGSVHINKTQ